MEEGTSRPLRTSTSTVPDSSTKMMQQGDKQELFPETPTGTRTSMMDTSKMLQGSVIALVMIIIAFILVVVGVSTDGWIYISGVNNRIGLERWAIISPSDSDKSKGRAAFAMCVIATLGSAFALTCVSIDVLLQGVKKTNLVMSKALILVTLTAGIVGGISGIIGCIIHVAWIGSKIHDDMGDNYYNPGYSFFLTFIGSVILMAGAIVSYRGNKKIFGANSVTATPV